MTRRLAVVCREIACVEFLSVVACVEFFFSVNPWDNFNIGKFVFAFVCFTRCWYHPVSTVLLFVPPAILSLSLSLCRKVNKTDFESAITV